MRAHAFSLVELIVVISVIAILAAMVAAKYVGAQQDASVAAAAEDLKAIELAVGMYRTQEGHWPRDVNRTQPVPELDNYFKNMENPFGKTCPIGGAYDWEGPPNWSPAQVSIRKNGQNVWTDADALALDQHFDDGDLSTGRFRRASGDRLAVDLEAN